jgi:4-amino-4-deoxy-L-arabinose transferase-like glycosyltransferase
MVVAAVSAGLLAQGIWIERSNHVMANHLVVWPLTLALLGASLGMSFLPPAAALRLFILSCGLCLLMMISTIVRSRDWGQWQRASAPLWLWTFWLVGMYGLGYLSSRERHRHAAARTGRDRIKPQE